MPAVCRGDSVDSDIPHCSGMKRNQRSDNVKVNGTGISRQGDHNTTHLKPQHLVHHIQHQLQLVLLLFLLMVYSIILLVQQEA